MQHQKHNNKKHNGKGNETITASIGLPLLRLLAIHGDERAKAMLKRQEQKPSLHTPSMNKTLKRG